MNNDELFAGMDDLDTAEVRKTKTTEETIMCKKCGGTGTRRYGYVNTTHYPCSTCKGTGLVTQQRLNRIAGAKRAEVTRNKNRSEKLALFTSENLELVNWLHKSAATFEFASSLLEALNQYGYLTEKQVAAAEKCMINGRKRLEELRAKDDARSVDLDATTILATLRKAYDSGLKRPKLITELVTFSLASPHSKNPGCVYVKASSDEYLGKVTPEGQFRPTRDCDEATKTHIVEVAKDVLQAAKLFGQQTGRCSCCGRELTDPASIAAGIGPICESRYF